VSAIKYSGSLENSYLLDERFFFRSTLLYRAVLPVTSFEALDTILDGSALPPRSYGLERGLIHAYSVLLEWSCVDYDYLRGLSSRA
jgi:hypothetical protein